MLIRFISATRAMGQLVALALMLLALSVAPARAVVVDNVTVSGGVLNSSTPAGDVADSLPIVTTAPSDDPGWYRTPTNRSAIYLGNQWVLSATHAGFGRVDLPGGSYEVIPNSDIILTNPTTFDGESASSASDLRLWRINTDTATGLTPEAADANLAADAFGTGLVQLPDSAPNLGTEVLMIGRGRARETNPGDTFGHFHYPSNNLNGFEIDTNDNNRIKTWGANRVARDSLFESGGDPDNQFLLTDLARDIIGQVTQFSSNVTPFGGQDATVAFEGQGAGGDSGGPVFFKENGDWKLAGVMHAITQQSGQPNRSVVFGNLTIFSDVSQAHYKNQINALLANDFEAYSIFALDRDGVADANGDGLLDEAERIAALDTNEDGEVSAAERAAGTLTNFTGYSLNGDINLDGVVNGDGSGSILTDDVSAFVAGWRHEQATGDIQSWKQGDLNLDGTTDLADFALLRNALGGSVSAAQFTSLLNAGTNTIPEPATWLLLTFLLTGLGLWRRRA